MNAVNLGMFESPMQILVALVVALFLFGPQKLPQIGRQLGTALRELNKAKDEMLGSVSSAPEYAYPPEPPPTESWGEQRSIAARTPDLDLTDYTLIAPERTRAKETQRSHHEDR
jgi:sec-independent protein translocase protein TatA